MPDPLSNDLIHDVDIIQRYENNPIILHQDVPFSCADICNAGAVKMGEEYILLITAQNMSGTYSVYLARSPDGYEFTVDAEPILAPSKGGDWVPYEEMGTEDVRITHLDGVYYLVYGASGRHGDTVALAKTADFKTVERMGIISQSDIKAGCLFPRKINGRYVALLRPWSKGSIWISYSDDLEFWGGSEVVMTPRAGYWDSARIGPATVPIEVNEGWLFVYYGVKETSAGPLFRLGAALLELDDPKRFIGRTNVPILSPRLLYERIGDVPNLVFSCGAILEPDGEFKLYYGAADACICLGTAQVSKIVRACYESEEEY